MGVELILYKVGEFEVEYAPRLSGIVAKAMVAGGALLIGYELSEISGGSASTGDISMMVAGALILPAGLALDKVRKTVKEIRRQNRLEEAVSRAA